MVKMATCTMFAVQYEFTKPKFLSVGSHLPPRTLHILVSWLFVDLCVPNVAVLQEIHGPNAPELIPQQPQQLQQLEDINSWVYTDLANGAYKAGFASSQLAYEAAYKQFFMALDRAEALLAKHK